MSGDVDDILEHYGTKGMKWGVRKKKTQRPGTRNYNPKKLNNQELKKVVARMRLEQEYAKLNENPSTKKGSNMATRILKKAGSKNLERVAEVGLGAVIGLALSQLPKLAKNPHTTKLLSEIAKKF